MKWLPFRVAVLLMAVSGCESADDDGREPISGKVTLDGKSVSGSITFVPDGQGPAVGSTIEEGEFALSRAEGPVPGVYRVEILSVQPTGRKIQDPEGPKGSLVDERKNVVPDRYGSRSELRADVKQAGLNQFSYELNSTPDKRPSKRRR